MEFSDFFGDDNQKYLVFCKSNCKYCDDVKELFINDDACYVNCDHFLKENRDEFINFMKKKINKNIITFPIVFDKNNNYVGGYYETRILKKILKR